MQRVEDALNLGFAYVSRHWVAAASIWATCVVAGAALTPWLAAQGFGTAAQLLYWMYRPLCPQRPDHSFFIAGHKLAFEQRETAMFLAAAVAGPLFVLLRPTRLRIPGWLAIAAVIPMGLDVVTQMIGLRASDGFWRSLTGSVAVVPFLLWAYPKLDGELSSAGARDRAEVASVRPPDARTLPEGVSR